MHVCLPFGINTGYGVTACAVSEHIIGFGIEVNEVIPKCLKDINCGIHIHTALVFGKALCKLDKTARRASTCGGIVVYGLCGSAEIYSRKPIVTAVCDKVVCYLLCGVKISFLISIKIGDSDYV